MNGNIQIENGNIVKDEDTNQMKSEVFINSNFKNKEIKNQVLIIALIFQSWFVFYQATWWIILSILFVVIYGLFMRVIDALLKDTHKVGDLLP